MKLFLARHGESEGNVLGLLQGHANYDLTDKGKHQAVLLGDRLKAERIDFIYASDLSRTTETARLVAKHHPEAVFNLTPILRERDMGDFTGKKKFDVDWSKPPVNFESDESVFKRLESFVNEVLVKHKGFNVMLVAHNQTQKVITGLLLKKHVSEISRPNNTALSIFEIGDEVKPEVINCTKHLD